MGELRDRVSGRTAKKTVTVSIAETVLETAERHDLDVSAIAEDALRRAGAEARRAAWLAENREALAAHDAWIEENGLPLAKYRLF